VAALSGRHAAAAAAEYVRGSAWPERRVRIGCEPPLAWISPSAVAARAGNPPRGRFLLRSREFVRRPRIEIVQDGRVLWPGRIGSLVPGRSARLPGGWTGDVDPAGGGVSVRVVSPG
jgi:hypothetical protein